MTNNPFYNVTLFNLTVADFDFLLVPETGPIPSPQSLLLENGKYLITIIQPQDTVRHALLGCFMDEWSKVEMQLARLLGLALSLNQDEMPVVMNALGTRGQRELIEALLIPRLKDDAALALSNILARVKSNATKRNYIVHGYWHLEVVVTDRNGVPWPNYRQFRRYDPSDSAARAALGERANSAARKTYMFSLPRIRKLSSDLGGLWDELSKITKESLNENYQKPVQLRITAPMPSAGIGA